MYKATSGDARLHLQAVSAGDPSIKFTSANNRSGDLYYTDATTLARFSYDHAAVAFKMYAHNNTSVDFYVSETEAYFAGQNVGIGTTSPSSYDGESDNLVVASGVDGAVPTPGITIACLGDTATTGRGSLRFADGTSSNAPYRGALEYNHNGDDMFLERLAQ